MRYVLALLALASISAAPAEAASGDVVLYAADAPAVYGAWQKQADSTAAGGYKLRHPDAGAGKIGTPLASPTNYFELTFTVTAGVPYRLWIRGKADQNYWANDSVYVQFWGSVDASGNPIFRHDTTNAVTVNIEDCSGCGLSGWGWQDDGWGVGVLGPVVYFSTTGQHKMRVQTREDGLSIDQIVLSSSTYMSRAPGALKNDTTILPKNSGSTTPPPSVTLVRGPYLQQVTSNSAVVVWATRDGSTAKVTYGSGTATATTNYYPTSMTGMSQDYYQHEATITGLSAATSYTYDLLDGGVDPSPGTSYKLTTAPSSDSATVTFVAWGDSGTGSTAEQTVASRIAGETFDFALHAGDLAYGYSDGTGGATYQTTSSWFFNVYNQWLGRRPVWPTMGNHDSRSSNNNGQPYLNLFVLPENGYSTTWPDHAERYYSFDWGPVHVVVLDTETSFQDTAQRPAELQWLQNDLAATSKPWKIALYHRSPYSSGGEHGSDLTVRSAFAPIFEKYGVQLSISGHEHDYERTVPIRTGTTGSKVVYVVTGGGGGPLYPSGTSSWTAYSASRYEYIKVTISGCTLTLRAIGSDGTVFDSTTITGC